MIESKRCHFLLVAILFNQFIFDFVFFHWHMFSTLLSFKYIFSKICLLTFPKVIFAGFNILHVGLYVKLSLCYFNLMEAISSGKRLILLSNLNLLSMF